MAKPSIIIKEKKKQLIKKENMTKGDAEFKAILWFLNQEYFKKPSNDDKNYEV